MDDLVRQALLRWPNVPSIAGWLKLSRRGEWLLTGDVPAGLVITHERMRHFMDRNYAGDEQGRWFFQNGPQKVYVALDYTPWVFGLHPVGQGYALLTHTRLVTYPLSLWMDEEGVLLCDTPLGVGVLDNAAIDTIGTHIEQTGDALALTLPWCMPDETLCKHRGWRLPQADTVINEIANPPVAPMPVHAIQRSEVPNHFGFVLNPDT